VLARAPWGVTPLESAMGGLLGWLDRKKRGSHR
jgi:hypothetical protein